VRNNNGGFVNVYALDVLSRRAFLNMTVRGAPTAPARSILGQRSLEKPTVLVTNQHSLGDGEDFTEGYRALGLGRSSASRRRAGSSTPGTRACSTAQSSGCRAPGSRTATGPTWRCIRARWTSR
jgi:hypothetical protein